jgi:4-hydroxy-tetrahydrodipicolinate synthase
MNTDLFSGVISPVLTPFNQDLSIDPKRYVALAKSMLMDGCSGLAPFGTTGEALSLGLKERRELLSALVEGGVDPKKLMPGTGLCNLPETVEHTRFALEAGVGGVMTLPPFYFKGMSDDGIYRYFAEFIERVGSNDLKVYLYHIPPQAIVAFSLELIGRLINDFPGVVVGLKDSSGDFNNTKAIIEAFPDFVVFPGSEVFLLDGMRAGGAGCITATANVNATMIRSVYDKWQSAEADELQAKITSIRQLIQTRPMIPMLKQITARKFRDSGWKAVRPPLMQIDDSVANELIEQINQQHNTTF